MRMKYIGILGAVVVSMLSFSFSSRGSSSTADAAQVESSEQGNVVSAELQHQISQVLWGCYARGEELVGIGDVDGAKAVLRRCFADDMKFEAVLPPAYADLGFTTNDGADGFVDFSNGFYRALDLVHVQHIISNIVITKTGLNTATVTSAALAIHAFADGRVFNANVTFTSDFDRRRGSWKIAHTLMTVHSITEAPAWVPPAPAN